MRFDEWCFRAQINLEAIDRIFQVVIMILDCLHHIVTQQLDVRSGWACVAGTCAGSTTATTCAAAVAVDAQVGWVWRTRGLCSEGSTTETATCAAVATPSSMSSSEGVVAASTLVLTIGPDREMVAWAAGGCNHSRALIMCKAAKTGFTHANRYATPTVKRTLNHIARIS